MSSPKIAIIIQARLGSKRLPQKVIKKVENTTILEHLINRLLPLNIPLYLAIPRGEELSFSFLKESYKDKLSLYGGSNENVLERYYQCAKDNSIDQIIRVTADNPLTSEVCLTHGLDIHLKTSSNLSHIIDIPHGSGVEYITFETLERAYLNAYTEEEKEHVTAFIYHHPHTFKVTHIPAPQKYQSHLRVTIDTQDDFNRYKKWVKKIGLEEGGYLSLEKVLDFPLI